MSSEREDLLEMLKIYAIEIDGMLEEYHATTDKSGAIPQLIISEKQKG